MAAHEIHRPRVPDQALPIKSLFRSTFWAGLSFFGQLLLPSLLAIIVLGAWFNSAAVRGPASIRKVWVAKTVFIVHADSEVESSFLRTQVVMLLNAHVPQMPDGHLMNYLSAWINDRFHRRCDAGAGRQKIGKWIAENIRPSLVRAVICGTFADVNQVNLHPRLLARRQIVNWKLYPSYYQRRFRHLKRLLGNGPLLTGGPPQGDREYSHNGGRYPDNDRPQVGWLRILVDVVGVMFGAVCGFVGAELWCRDRPWSGSAVFLFGVFVGSFCSIYMIRGAR